MWRVKKEGERGEGGNKSIAFVNVEGEQLKRNGSEVRGLLMINRQSKGLVVVQNYSAFCVIPDK